MKRLVLASADVIFAFAVILRRPFRAVGLRASHTSSFEFKAIRSPKYSQRKRIRVFPFDTRCDSARGAALTTLFSVPVSAKGAFPVVLTPTPESQIGSEVPVGTSSPVADGRSRSIVLEDGFPTLARRRLPCESLRLSRQLRRCASR